MQIIILSHNRLYISAVWKHLCTLANMARLVLCVLAVLAAGGLADPVIKVQQKPAEKSTLERQYKLMILFYHIHEPNHFKEHQEIEKTWDIEKNAQHYENATAVRIVSQLIHNHWHLPRTVPFSVLETTHLAEAEFMFNLLFSAKNFETFYKTAVYLRPHLNEYMYVYVLSTAILHRRDTQDIIVPPLHSIIPSFFHNSQVMTTAQRIAVHGKRWVDQFPSTHLWDDNVVINVNETMWPYINDETRIAYFTHDVALNSLYYNTHLTYPFWIAKETCPLIKDNRGELFWWWHKQILTLYYMHRLSNGLGEIPELDENVVLEGYNPGLSYMDGVSFPYRPNHFHLDAPWVQELLQDIEIYENRIREAIDRGVITNEGKIINIRTPEYIDLLGRLIEANDDSPNVHYYKDFISIWKRILGNSPVTPNNVQYRNQMYPLVLPSVLELHQTALRDPAFYMIMKRVLRLFQWWHESLPSYTHEELALPAVEIEKVDVDKLVTYFEYTHLNVTNHLHMSEFEYEHGYDTKSVLVKRPQLNHKVFTIRVNVHSEAAKHVTVRYYLAPKYDSQGKLIPLVENTQNFFLLDEFDHELKQGDNVITTVSNEITLASPDLWQGYELFQKVEDALNGGGQFMWESLRKPDAWPNRLLLPKGRVGGMPFVLMVYISEYKAPNVVYGTGFDPVSSLGLGTGARRLTAEPLGFPVDRPLHQWQVEGLKNIWFQDVLIHHKETPEVVVQHF